MTRGGRGVQKPENLRDVIYGWALSTNLLVLLALIGHGNGPDREVEGVVDADARNGPEQRRRVLDGDRGEGKP